MGKGREYPLGGGLDAAVVEALIGAVLAEKFPVSLEDGEVVGVLPVANGGTGNTTGLPAGSAPNPQIAAGVGQFIVVRSNASQALPAGGSWIYWIYTTETTGGAVYGAVVDVLAGGKAIPAAKGSGGRALQMNGFAWRIA
jgi:hypothetical protein